MKECNSATERALEPATIPWEYCRPSRTIDGWITVEGMLQQTETKYHSIYHKPYYKPSTPHTIVYTINHTIYHKPSTPYYTHAIVYTIDHTINHTHHTTHHSINYKPYYIPYTPHTYTTIDQYLICCVRGALRLYWCRWENRLTL